MDTFHACSPARNMILTNTVLTYECIIDHFVCNIVCCMHRCIFHAHFKNSDCIDCATDSVMLWMPLDLCLVALQAVSVLILWMCKDHIDVQGCCVVDVMDVGVL